MRLPEPPSGRRWPVQCPLTPLDPVSSAWYLLNATPDRVAGRRVGQSQNRRLEESYAMCARFPVMRSTPEQANLRWRLKTGGAVWRSIHRSASTRTPKPNKRQSVGAGREARSGAITRRGSARQPIWAAWPPSAPSSVSLGRLFTPFSSNLEHSEPLRAKNACSCQNGASG